MAQNNPFILSIVFITLISYNISAQEQEDIEKIIENQFQFQDEDIPFEELYENSLLQISHPLNLNDANFQDLEQLQILSSQQINEVLTHRKLYGDYISVNELLNLETIDENSYNDLLPFVTVMPSQKDYVDFIQTLKELPNNYLFIRNSMLIETPRGYNNEKGYLGNKNHHYLRFRTFEKDKFSLGITAEKDAGEPLEWTEKSKGLDFYSYHLQINNLYFIEKIILGDYKLQFGQSLVFSGGFATGKGAETIFSIKRANLGLIPYTSSLETGFFRGVATTFKRKKWTATFLFSRLQQDGNIDTLESNNYTFLNSIQISGLHRTQREIENKNTVTEQNIGANFNYNIDNQSNIGFNILNTSYNIPLTPNPKIYNTFEFNDNQNLLYSLYSNYLYRNFYFFGELAQSKSSGIGAVFGFISSLTPKIDFSFLYRNFDKNFHSFYANAFGESYRNINEWGLYWGLEFRPNEMNKINIYYDYFNFPFLKFGVNAPSDGYEFLIKYNFKPNKKSNYYLVFRQQLQQKNFQNEDSKFYTLKDKIKQNIIADADFEIAKWFSMKTRIQYSQQQFNEYSNGILLLQDLNLKLKKLKFSTRFCLFDTDNFDNRQYVYEKDVLYSFSIPAFNDTGIRQYFLIHYKINSKLELWCKYAITQFPKKSTIRTGLNEIEGNTESILKTQLKYVF